MIIYVIFSTNQSQTMIKNAKFIFLIPQNHDSRLANKTQNSDTLFVMEVPLSLFHRFLTIPVFTFLLHVLRLKEKTLVGKNVLCHVSKTDGRKTVRLGSHQNTSTCFYCMFWKMFLPHFLPPFHSFFSCFVSIG